MPFAVATEGVSFAAAQISIRNDRGGAQISNSDVVLGLNAAAVAFGLLGSWKSGCYALSILALFGLCIMHVEQRSAGAAVAYAYLSVLVGWLFYRKETEDREERERRERVEAIARLSDEDIAEMQDWLEEQGLGVRPS